MGPRSLYSLEVWRGGLEIAQALYGLTRDWPKEETYGLTAQVRRAAVSIPANLAEGVGRATSREMARFAHIALGSLYELETLLHLAAQLGYGDQKAILTVRARLSRLSKQVSSFIRHHEHKAASPTNHGPQSTNHSPQTE